MALYLGAEFEHLQMIRVLVSAQLPSPIFPCFCFSVGSATLFY